MAKADDASSTIVWIWLREALRLAIAALGSVALAKEQLREWLAAGKLPWDCMKWEGLDAEGIARLERESRTGSIVFINIPSAVYHRGDPQFWSTGLKIDWEDNRAREAAIAGAQALGIKVSRTHLLELLPKEPRERTETPRQTQPADRKLEPKVWLAWAREEYPQQRNERSTPYIRRLHGLMQKADNVTEVWAFETFRVRYYEAVKTNQ